MPSRTTGTAPLCPAFSSTCVKVALAHQGGRTIWHVIRDQVSPLACARQSNSYADSKYTPHLAAQLEDADQHSRLSYPGRRWTLL